MSAKSKKCAGFPKGKCKVPIYSDSVTGLCSSCLKRKLAADAEARRQLEIKAREDSERRLAKEAPQPIDLLRRDNADLQRKVAQQREVISEYEAKGGLEDRIIGEIREFIERNPYKPQLGPRPVAKPGTSKDHEMMAVISDAHYPEVVDPAQTFGLRYGPEVCKDRMTYLRNKLIRYVDLRSSSYPIRKLTLAVIGDMLSGDIHEELEVTNAMPTSEALTGMTYMLHDLGSAMAETVPEVEMIVLPGNHPRITKKPRFKQRFNNWETVMGHFIQALAKDRFQVTVPRDLVYRHKIFNRVVGLSHGDGVKAQSFAGIPHYAMEKRRTKLQSLLRQVGAEQLDLLVYGHFHQLIFEEGQGCSLLVNGSIKGGDEYSTGTNYGAQAPVQALLTFHPKHGITDISRINLGHII